MKVRIGVEIQSNCNGQVWKLYINEELKYFLHVCIHFSIYSQAHIIASVTNHRPAWMVVQFYAVAVDTIQRKLSSRSDAIANSIGVAMLNVTHVLE